MKVLTSKHLLQNNYFNVALCKYFSLHNSNSPIAAIHTSLYTYVVTSNFREVLTGVKDLLIHLTCRVIVIESDGKQALVTMATTLYRRLMFYNVRWSTWNLLRVSGIESKVHVTK